MKFLPVTFVICATLIATSYEKPTLEPTKPLFYGWFFNEEIAASLENITTNYLVDLYYNNIVFRDYLYDMAQNEQVTDPLEYYTKPTDPNTGEYDPYFHITAHYCGEEDCSAYSSMVNKYLGKEFSTQLVGVFMTPRTYGIRVNLSAEQHSIFDETGSKLTPIKVPGDTPSFPGIDFQDQDSGNFQPTISRAHTTLGCAPNVPAVTTGTDLLEIIELEQTPEAFCGNFTQAYGTLISMGRDCDIYVYYLNQKMIANSQFQVYNNGNSTKTRLASAFEYGLFGVSFTSILKFVALYIPNAKFLSSGDSTK